MTRNEALDSLRAAKTLLQTAVDSMQRVRPRAETDVLDRALGRIELDMRHALAHVGDIQLMLVLQGDNK